MIAAQFGIMLVGLEPFGGFGIDEGGKDFATTFGFAVVMNLQALAVVGDDGDHIRAGFGLAPGPEGFKQAERDGNQRERFQQDTKPTQPGRFNPAIIPGKNNQSQSEQDDARPEKGPVRKN